MPWTAPSCRAQPVAPHVHVEWHSLSHLGVRGDHTGRAAVRAGAPGLHRRTNCPLRELSGAALPFSVRAARTRSTPRRGARRHDSHRARAVGKMPHGRRPHGVDRHRFPRIVHAWNVKRIRPAEWTPMTFPKACPSRMGYVAEGVTTYRGTSSCSKAAWSTSMAGAVDRAPSRPPRQQPRAVEHERGRFELRHAGWTGTWPGCPGARLHLRGRRRAGLFVRCAHHATDRRRGLAATAMRLLWEQFGEPRSA